MITSWLGSSHFLSLLVAYFNFLYGPLIYLFVASLYRRVRQKELLLHSLPFLIGYSANLGITLAGVRPEQVQWLEVPLFELLLIYTLTYSTMAVFQLTTYCRQRHDLRWLRFFLAFLTAIYWCAFITTNLILIGVEEASIIYPVNQLAMMVLVYALAYKLYLSRGVLLEMNGSKRPLAEGERYSRSGLGRDQLDSHLARLHGHMADKKPYLDKEFNIQQLSEQTGISKNHLSQILNQGLSKNFHEYINELRVEEVKRLLVDENYSHLTINAIGLQAGYKSKSAFNTNFKRTTGKTPVQWKQQYMANNA